MLTPKRLAAMEAAVCLALASDIEGEPDSYGGVAHEDMDGAHSWIAYQREKRGWNKPAALTRSESEDAR